LYNKKHSRVGCPVSYLSQMGYDTLVSHFARRSIIQLAPLPQMIPSFLWRRVRRDPQLDRERPHLFLGYRNPVQPSIGPCQLFARISDLIVLSLQLPLARHTFRTLEQLPCTVDRPVPQHTHRPELQWAWRVLGWVVEEVTYHSDSGISLRCFLPSCFPRHSSCLLLQDIARWY